LNPFMRNILFILPVKTMNFPKFEVGVYTPIVNLWLNEVRNQ
jgi:hypothetical protein